VVVNGQTVAGPGAIGGEERKGKRKLILRPIFGSGGEGGVFIFFFPLLSFRAKGEKKKVTAPSFFSLCP